MQTSTTSTDTSSAAPATFLGYDENGMAVYSLSFSL
jgi:hypothetical protein